MSALVERIRELRLFQWAAVAMPILGAVTFLGGIWWNSQEDKILNERWYAEDKEWNDEILGSLSDIRLRLEDIEQRQYQHATRLDQIERLTQEELDELEQDHKAIAEAAWQIGIEIAETLGRHDARHELEGK